MFNSSNQRFNTQIVITILPYYLLIIQNDIYSIKLWLISFSTELLFQQYMSTDTQKHIAFDAFAISTGETHHPMKLSSYNTFSRYTNFALRDFRWMQL